MSGLRYSESHIPGPAPGVGVADKANTPGVRAGGIQNSEVDMSIVAAPPAPTKPAPAIKVIITDRAPCPIRRQQLWALIQRVVKS